MRNNISNWSQVKFKDLLTYTNDLVELDDTKEYTTITVKRRHGGLQAREKLFGTQIKTKKQYKLLPGAFIISRVQCWHEAYAIVPYTLGASMIASVNYDQFIISPDIDQRFFWWLSFSPTFTQTVRDCAFGVVIEKMVFNRNAWLNKSILLPPLEEQRRIVARIEELAAKIEEARGLRREAVEEASRLLSTTISQKLTEIKHQSREVKLASVAISVTDGDHQPPPKADSGIPFILISNITSGKLDLTDCRWVPEEYYLSISANRVPKRGDILYTAVGATYGTPCLVDIEEPFCFQRHIAIIKPDKTQINSEYLKLVLSSRYVYNQATHFVTGSAQPTIPLSRIRQLKFPLPSLEKQSQLVTHFNELQTRLNSLKQQQSQTSAELNALLPSILDKAFKGEL